MSHNPADELMRSRLEDLQQAAAKKGIEIRFDAFSDPDIATQSGYCKVRGQSLIVVDSRLHRPRQVEVILKIFRQFDWEDVYLPSWIREHLENPELTGFAS